jgi:hypothetical protein
VSPSIVRTAALALAICSAGVAAAQPKPDPRAAQAGPKPLAESLTGVARAEYEAGKILFADGDFANAIVKFKKAHELSSDPRLLWNIAVCEKNLRRYSRMLDSIRRYLDEAGSVLTAEERQRADEIVATVQGFVSELHLRVDQKGADVLVDGEKVGVTPLAGKVMIDVGHRKITVRKQGFRDAVKEIEVTGGGKTELDVSLTKELHRGRLRVEAGAEDIIALDGKVVGKGTWEGSIKSGGHTLRVTGEGMVPLQQEVLVKDGETRTVPVELEEEASDPTATILWVVGGVSLAAVAGVTSGFLFQRASADPVEGNIDPGTVQLTVGSW